MLYIILTPGILLHTANVLLCWLHDQKIQNKKHTSTPSVVWLTPNSFAVITVSHSQLLNVSIVVECEEVPGISAFLKKLNFMVTSYRKH